MSLIPIIDELGCCGHGDCAVIAPHVFRVDEIAVVIGEGTDDELRAAAAACPAAAIFLEERAANAT